MGHRTKISWCDSTWNPVTGCLHGCEYCYARRIAERFGGCWRLDLPGDTSWRNFGESGLMGDYARHSNRKCHVLDQPEIECAVFDPPSGYRGKVKPYPYYFDPTFDDCLERFEEGRAKGIEEVANCWFGASASTNKELDRANESKALWLSIEPIRERIATDENQFVEVDPYTGCERKRWEWVVIGSETGNSKHKTVPKREWVEEIVKVCKEYGTPVFMKESLRGLMGEDFRQEFPWEV